MENFGKFIVVVLGMIIIPIIKGFVLSKLWLWFIVPIFQIQPLRVIEAIGIIFLINFIRLKRDKPDDSEEFWVGFAYNIGFTIVMGCFALLFGWVVTLFIQDIMVKINKVIDTGYSFDWEYSPSISKIREDIDEMEKRGITQIGD